MLTVNEYYKNLFGEKVYKIALAGGVTCPNRDGKAGVGGCIFCSRAGSGDFVPGTSLPMEKQLDEAIQKVKAKGASKFIAYFQSFTFTYLPSEIIEQKLSAVYRDNRIVGVSIATRPDCLEKEKLDIIERYSKLKPTWVELGLQSANDKTAEYINRGYKTEVYLDAARRLTEKRIPFVTHIILGLPGESEIDMQNTVKTAVDAGSEGIKLQLLQILTDSRLYEEYLKGNVTPMGEEEYFELLEKILPAIPENVVLHRLTGDGSKKTLAAPMWCADKKKVLNRINALLKKLTLISGNKGEIR